MTEQPFDMQSKPARIIDLWKLDEEGSPEYPAQVIAHSHILKLNKTATLIWRLLDGHHSVEEIIELVCKECEGADPRQVEEDTVRLLQDFAARNAIDLNPDPLLGL
jgi:hypothetical protein